MSERSQPKRSYNGLKAVNMGMWGTPVVKSIRERMT